MFVLRDSYLSAQLFQTTSVTILSPAFLKKNIPYRQMLSYITVNGSSKGKKIVKSAQCFYYYHYWSCFTSVLKKPVRCWIVKRLLLLALLQQISTKTTERRIKKEKVYKASS